MMFSRLRYWMSVSHPDTPFSPTYEEWLEANKGKGYNQTGQHTDTENFKQWVKNDKYAAVEANRNLRRVYGK